jgi:hypothetical protein
MVCRTVMEHQAEKIYMLYNIGLRPEHWNKIAIWCDKEELENI